MARLIALLRTVLGGALLAAGVLVGPWGVFLSLGIAEDARSRLSGDTASDEPGLLAEFPWPTSTLVVAAAGATALLVLAVTVGLRLVRGNRRLVLFLRRFRDAEAIGALSSAAAGGVGQAWRVVTLDDGDIAPVGVAARTRRFFGVLRASARVFRVASTTLPKVGVGLILAAAGVVGLRYLQTGRWDLELLAAALPTEEPLLGVLPAPPALGWDLETLLYLLVAGGTLLLAFGVLTFLALPVVFVLIGPAVLVQEASDAVRAAEDSSRAAVSDVTDLGEVTARVVSESRKVFAPRLVVVTVDHACWRQCVRSFAEVAAATVVDVSEPSEHVLWEIQQVRARPGSRLVLIGHLPELRPLLDEVPRGERSEAEVDVGAGLDVGIDEDPRQPGRRLAALIDGEEVLAYTLTFVGRRRFARALRSTLLCRREVDLPAGGGTGGRRRPCRAKGQVRSAGTP